MSISALDQAIAAIPMIGTCISEVAIPANLNNWSDLLRACQNNPNKFNNMIVIGAGLSTTEQAVWGAILTRADYPHLADRAGSLWGVWDKLSANQRQMIWNILT